jgi:hypothetical protein
MKMKSFANAKGFFIADTLLTPFDGFKKKNPRLKSGGPNQKPLTIKPYPMKIHDKYR